MMLRLVAVILVLACGHGCATTGGKVSAGIGAIAMTGAVITGATVSCSADALPFVACQNLGATVGLALIAGAAFVSALVFETFAAPKTPVQPVVPPDPHAERLTVLAQRAARLRRCHAVRSLGMRVRSIDPEYYERVFATDPVIANCD